MIHQAAKNPWNCQGSHNPKTSCVVSSYCITVLDTHTHTYIYITYQFDVFYSCVRACSHEFPGMLILMRCITGPGSDVRNFLSSPPCLEELIAFFSVLFPLSCQQWAGAQCSFSFDYVCWCHTWGMAPNVKPEDSVCIIILHKSELNTCLEVSTIVVNHLLVWSDATLILPKDWQCVSASCISTIRSRWFLFTKFFLIRSQLWHSKSLPQNHCLFESGWITEKKMAFHVIQL